MFFAVNKTVLDDMFNVSKKGHLHYPCLDVAEDRVEQGYDLERTAGMYVHRLDTIVLVADYPCTLDERLNVMHHEMIHCFCRWRGIEDGTKTSRNLHTRQFKQAIEDHGGIAHYLNPEHGWQYTEIRPELMPAVKEYFWQSYNRKIKEDKQNGKKVYEWHIQAADPESQ